MCAWRMGRCAAEHNHDADDYNRCQSGPSAQPSVARLSRLSGLPAMQIVSLSSGEHCYKEFVMQNVGKPSQAVVVVNIYIYICIYVC